MTQSPSILGIAARRVATPATLEDAETLLRDARRNGERVAFLGSGTELDLGYPPLGIDLLIETAELARVVEYAPADMTISVEAGLRLDALAAILAPHGQRLALDPPSPQATLGGLIATNGSGPRRMRYGSLRDLIVGVSLIRADGTRVRGGGKVVKNVAGFDLPKLAVGSLGTLGMIATATFRLHPLPERTVRVEIHGCSTQAIRRWTMELEREQYEPAAFVALDDGDASTLDLCFEGFAAGAEEQAARLVAAATKAGHEAALADAAAQARLEALHTAARCGGDWRCKLTFPPAKLMDVERYALRSLRSAVREAAVAIYPAAGIAYLAGNEAHAGQLVTAVARAREVLGAAGGALVQTAASPAMRAASDVFGGVPPAIELMHALKMRFDPERRLNPGRFVGGL
jgi:glycolate oxidase FAD binding subunit